MMLNKVAPEFISKLSKIGRLFPMDRWSNCIALSSTSCGNEAIKTIYGRGVEWVSVDGNLVKINRNATTKKPIVVDATNLGTEFTPFEKLTGTSQKYILTRPFWLCKPLHIDGAHSYFSTVLYPKTQPLAFNFYKKPFGAMVTLDKVTVAKNLINLSRLNMGGAIPDLANLDLEMQSIFSDLSGMYDHEINSPAIPDVYKTRLDKHATKLYSLMKSICHILYGKDYQESANGLLYSGGYQEGATDFQYQMAKMRYDILQAIDIVKNAVNKGKKESQNQSYTMLSDIIDDVLETIRSRVQYDVFNYYTGDIQYLNNKVIEDQMRLNTQHEGYDDESIEIIKSSAELPSTPPSLKELDKAAGQYFAKQSASELMLMVGPSSITITDRTWAEFSPREITWPKMSPPEIHIIEGETKRLYWGVTFDNIRLPEQADIEGKSVLEIDTGTGEWTNRLLSAYKNTPPASYRIINSPSYWWLPESEIERKEHLEDAVNKYASTGLSIGLHNCTLKEAVQNGIAPKGGYDTIIINGYSISGLEKEDTFACLAYLLKPDGKILYSSTLREALFPIKEYEHLYLSSTAKVFFDKVDVCRIPLFDSASLYGLMTLQGPKEEAAEKHLKSAILK